MNQQITGKFIAQKRKEKNLTRREQEISYPL